MTALAMGTTVRGLATTFAGSVRETLANRRGFALQVSVMVVNDLVWLVFWLVFFDRFGSIRGWTMGDMIVLLAVLTTSVGTVIGLFSNARRIGVLVSDGTLDAALTLPVPTLAYLLVRRIDVVFVGDIVYGLILFLTLGRPTPTRLALFIAVTAMAALLFGGFLVLAGCSAFAVGRSEVGDLGFHALTLFASYPVDVFAGPTKLFLYAVVPAGFVSTVPSRLINGFDPVWALALAGVSMLAATLAGLAFNRGLRHYTSGAVGTAR